MQTPLLYFRALAPGQYLVVAPMFVTADDPAARVVVLEPGLPIQDMQPGGLVSGTDVRVVHIADRLLHEIDGPMLKTGLQGFHGQGIALPRRSSDRPDPHRLESRFERFLRAAA